MSDWITWFISLWRTMVVWLTDSQIFGISLIAFIISVFLLGVTLRALLYKA